MSHWTTCTTIWSFYLSPFVSISECYLEQQNGCSWQLLLRSEANSSDISTFAVGATLLNSFDPWCFDKTHPKWWKNDTSVLLLKYNDDNHYQSYQLSDSTLWYLCRESSVNFYVCADHESLDSLYRAQLWILNLQGKVLYISSLMRGWKKSIHSLKPALSKPPSRTWLDGSIREEGSGVAVLLLMWLLSHLQIECHVGSRASDSCWSSWSTWTWCRRELLD